MRYFKKLVGEKCYLSPMNIDDAEQFAAWLNDLEVSEYLSASSNAVTVESQKKELEERAEDHVYEIVDVENDKAIGMIAFSRIDHRNGSGKVGMFIGDKAYWGKGYGREALRLLLGFAFNYLNLNSVLLTVREDNVRPIACYEAVGFRPAGRYRQSIMRNGRYYDEVVLDILAEEFRSLHGAEA